MADFAQAFQNDQNKILGAVQLDRSAASSGFSPSCKVTWLFFHAHGGIYLVNVFPS